MPESEQLPLWGPSAEECEVFIVPAETLAEIGQSPDEAFGLAFPPGGLEEMRRLLQ